MRYAERPEFPYDPDVFKLQDTQTALAIYDEAVEKHGPRPSPSFFEVDRSTEKLDPLWHTPVGGRDSLLRRLEIPCLTKHLKNEWTMTAKGLTPQRREEFTISHLSLIRLDYFPSRGDLVLFNGYRHMIVHVEIPGEAYWHQTNVWLGLVARCVVPPDGDGKSRIPSADELQNRLRLPSRDTTVVNSPPDVPGRPTI